MGSNEPGLLAEDPQTKMSGKATVFREYEGDEQGDDEFWSSPVPH